MTNAVYLASLVNSSGNNVTLQGGVVGSGTGIAFPATQVASSDANTLDDYEEGTWTPTDGGGTTQANTKYAFYVKIGRTVWAWCGINPTNNTATNPHKIGGLPFSPTAVTSSAQAGWVGYTTVGSSGLYCHAENSGNWVAFYQGGGSAQSIANTQIIFGVCYQVTA